MDDIAKKNLRERLWRSSLSSAKEAEIAEFDPELRDEIGLNQLLDQLPDAPVASNFTSRVLQAVALEEAKLSRAKRGWPAWRVGFGWVSRLAIAGFACLVGFLSFQQYQSHQRTQLAQSVEKMSHVASLPTDWLENFDTINHLSQSVPADQELLAMLQ